MCERVYICVMKRWMIWAICMVMGTSFVVLLYLQMQYARSIEDMRRRQFDVSVFRSLDQASRDMERMETALYLQEVVSMHNDSLGMRPFLDNTVRNRVLKFQQQVANAYLYEQGVLDEVIMTVLYASSNKSFEQRIDPMVLEETLTMSLRSNGIDLPFHFRVFTSSGEEVYRCPDYDATGNNFSYTQTLFRSDPSGKMGTMSIHFPTLDSYIRSANKTIILALIFTVVLFVTFLFTVYLVVRQKKITEMKNDFIHNMTHEFKTPISTISIAAQMLADRTIQKSQDMYVRLGDVIVSETKRLRFQVEKVLQMSLYDGGNIALKLQTLDANSLIDAVVQTFSLKVTQNGGTVDVHLDAMDADVYVDEMHFTNIIFNLMDNAVKYRREDVELHLDVSTWNQGNSICIQISDNGIGIRREDLKRIFEKFYRVHTGNKHNVKGFGLGLAYVYKMVVLHHGTIKATSELNKGTKFLITMPLSKG